MKEVKTGEVTENRKYSDRKINTFAGGKRKSNVVHDFIQLLLKPYNTTSSLPHSHISLLAGKICHF